jgi:RimJ/RimL family protein N-acetyltransferase
MGIAERKILLKPVSIKDAEAIARWYNNPENVKYMSTLVRCNQHTKASVEKELKESDPDYERLFMIFEEGNPKPIGHAGIDDLDLNDRRGEVFFIIGETSAQGKGYGKLAMKDLLWIAFRELRLNSVFATAAVENKPSIAILERLGFKRIGIRREYNFVDGEFMDEIFFDITKKDYDGNGLDRSTP